MCDPLKPFTDIHEIDDLHSDLNDEALRLTPDERTAYFSSDRSSMSLLYVTQRSDRHLPFEPPTSLAVVGRAPTPTPDNLSIVYTDYSSVTTDNDIYLVTRASPSDPFVPQGTVAGLNSTAAECCTSFNAAGDRLYFTFNGPPLRTDDLMVTPWPALQPQPLTELNTNGQEFSPAISADELVLYFGLGFPTSADVYVATRTSTITGFAPARPVNELNTSSGDIPTHISADLCRLYFYSDRINASFDLYIAERTP